MARVVAVALHAEPDELSRPCILMQFLTIDPLLEGGLDVNEERIVINPSETVAQLGARVGVAARNQIPRLNVKYNLAMTVAAGDCIIPVYTKV